jgi:hypothetical protein
VGVLALALLVVVAGCTGGGGSAPEATTTPPDVGQSQSHDGSIGDSHRRAVPAPGSGTVYQPLFRNGSCQRREKQSAATVGVDPTGVGRVTVEPPEWYEE